MSTINEINGAYFIDVSLSWSDLMTIKIALENVGILKSDNLMKTVTKSFDKLNKHILKLEYKENECKS